MACGSDGCENDAFVIFVSTTGRFHSQRFMAVNTTAKADEIVLSTMYFSANLLMLLSRQIAAPRLKPFF